MIKYCLPLVKTRGDEVLSELERHASSYDYLEVWLDHLEDLSDEFIERILSNYETKLILLLRRQGLAEPVVPPARRAEIVRRIARTRALLDLDIGSQRAELEVIKGLHGEGITPRLIVSYHNYTETPRELDAILVSMEEYRPEIRKASCLCQSEKDALFLLSLGLKLREENKRHVILGMGEHGIATRIFGTLWGNEMIFAPCERTALSAPGQLLREDLEAIFERIPKYLTPSHSHP